MNVEGLTRENVASHLQKFRLQLKRENKLDDEGNLISPLKGSKLGGSDDYAHGSATSQDKDVGGARCSSSSSHQASLPSISPIVRLTQVCCIIYNQSFLRGMAAGSRTLSTCDQRFELLEVHYLARGCQLHGYLACCLTGW